MTTYAIVEIQKKNSFFLCQALPLSLSLLGCLFYFRSWAPDRTLSQARKYIEEALGKLYADGVVLNLHQTWSESDVRTPLICFLSMGSDPTISIEVLAKALKLGMEMSTNFFLQDFSSFNVGLNSKKICLNLEFYRILFQNFMFAKS